MFRFGIRLFLLFFSPIFASAQITPDAEWFACKTAVDCIAEEDACHLKEAINKKFLGNYRAWRAEIQSIMECNDAPEQRIDAAHKIVPVCSQGRCSLPVPPLKADKPEGG